ncbi:MAG: PAS domain S-box protein [Clostridiaceae bacterium]|nr:PAS domain S-box protein [Clostridiaceae bacterium]
MPKQREPAQPTGTPPIPPDDQALRRHAPDLMRQVIEHSRSPIAVHDREMCYLYVSRSYLTSYRVREEDVIGKNHYDVFPDLPEKWHDAHRRAMAGEVVYGEHDPYEREDGTVDWTDWECRPWYEPDGRIGGIIVYTEVINDRRRTEMQAGESLARLQALLDNSPSQIMLFDAQGRYVEVSAAVAASLGRSASSIVGKSVTDMFDQKTAETFMRTLRQMQIDKKPVDKIDILKVAGEVRYYETKLFPVVDPDGGVELFGSIVHDVTERTRIQSALQRERERAQQYLDVAGVIMLAVDLEGKITMINQKGCEVLGLPREEAIGSNWFERFLPPEEAPAVREVFGLISAGKRLETLHYENPVLTAEGETRLVAWNNVVLADMEGQVVSILSSGEDITDRREAELALIESEYKYRSYIDHAPDAIFVLDRQGRYVEVNRAATDLTGYPQNRLLHMQISDLCCDESVRACTDHMERLMKSGASSALLCFRHASGENRWWRVDSVRYSDDRYLEFAKDVTAQKVAEEKLTFLSYHDQLTGVYNRRFFEEELRRLDTSRNLPIALVMGDINGLKLVNDSFGHLIGDQLLQRAAEAIRKCCRADDIIARLGGDEFALILPQTDTEAATGVISRILESIAQVRVSNIELSVSFGCETKSGPEQTMAEVLANAENQMYRRKLSERSSMKSKTVEVIMSTLFAKSHRESLHSQRVSGICRAIASRMGLSKDDVSQIATAGLVHDIGKIGIDERILNSTGKLAPAEWEEIKKHSETGWRILSSIDEFSELAEFVYEHHERWNGSGYPRALRGEEIALEARIIAVADAYDAMTRDRTYRETVTREEAAAELIRCAGTQFDPMVVEVFVRQVLPDAEVLM